MFRSTFPLLDKKQLTHDVYELRYAYNTKKTAIAPADLPAPGQYVMFQLVPGLNRSYSVAFFDDETFSLIIKRISDGRGSPLICDAQIGTEFSGIMSLGHFVLQDTMKSKCFIGTGTGFAPLYAQLLACQKNGLTESSTAFIFGVRELQDSFYHAEIQALGASFHDFCFVPYFSRESPFSGELVNTAQTGYVTDWILPENIEKYEEFYICGSPSMVRDARDRLESLGIAKESVFFEQY